MAERAVLNASPLIFLSRGGHLEFLQALAHELWVPQPVAEEIGRRGPDDPTAHALATIQWLEVCQPPAVPSAIGVWSLGAGESSVLALAAAHPGTEAIIDDLAARKCAAAANIPVRGTLGIVLVAKKRGLIPKARPILEDLVKGGLYLSKKVLDQALKRVGE